MSNLEVEHSTYMNAPMALCTVPHYDPRCDMDTQVWTVKAMVYKLMLSAPNGSHDLPVPDFYHSNGSPSLV
jgi:hypothetical protein